MSEQTKHNKPDWIYCPHCGKKLFANYGQGFTIESYCNGCYAKILFHSNDEGDLTHEITREPKKRKTQYPSRRK